ncbi:uncharacterized protein LOC125855679 [Solanum stenotomum]|uniref:uncharacterized protein LOC125855679 n=1 Tax=Solanum stenotomum TaxID=172797 RepID=UPI0020D0DF1B|nr:uncharacterized protein LOC125855679 [Solanum stenotomum]
MKKDIAEFFPKCPNCQQVKVEHQTPGSFSQDFSIPIWKCEDLNMDFMIGLPRIRRQHDSIWAIVDRMTKSAYFIPDKVSFSAEDYAKLYLKEVYISNRLVLGCEAALIGPKLVHEAMEKVRLIRERLKTAQSQQKSYADVKRSDLEIEILRRNGKVAYELELPSELALVHPVFHVSLVKKSVGDATSIVPLEGLGVKENLSSEEIPVEILDRRVKKLRNNEIVSVKDLWRNQLVEGATWEAETDMIS